MSFPTCFLCGDTNLAISTRTKRVILPEFGGDGLEIACGDLERAALKGWISEQACENLVKRLQPHCLCLDPKLLVFHQQYFGPSPAPFSIEAPTTIQTVYLGPELSNNSSTTGILAITAAVILFCGVMIVMARLIVSIRRTDAAGVIVQGEQDVTADELGQVKKMEMRGKVLKLMFPERPRTPTAHSTEVGESDESTNLAYDKEANLYQWTTSNTSGALQKQLHPNDEERDTSMTPCCSICLEQLLGTTIITLTCAHAFHHACVMEWVKKCKDDCAMCRTRMWNEELYKRLEQDVLLNEVGTKKVKDSTNSGPTTA